MSEQELKLIDVVKKVAKEEGVELLEETVKDIVPVVLVIAKAVATHSGNPFAMSAYALLEGPVKDLLLEQAEKINPND